MKRKLLAVAMIVMIGSSISTISAYALELPFVPVETEETIEAKPTTEKNETEDNETRDNGKENNETKDNETEDNETEDNETEDNETEDNETRDNEVEETEKSETEPKEEIVPVEGVNGQVETNNKEEVDVTNSEQDEDEKEIVADVATPEQLKKENNLPKVISAIVVIMCITGGIFISFVKRKKNG